MSKYYSTELGRRTINDAMDVMGGAGISMGPRNVLAEIYIAMPIGITVEGANIMTRTLIIFGQGALRAHPYAFKEVDSIEKGDLKSFDAAFWGHVGHIVRNSFRSFCLSITRGYVTYFNYSGPLKMYYRRLTWASASFAILADLAMGTLGGNLKFREKITGRFADILAWMYIATSTLRRFEAEGQRASDLPYAKFVLKHALSEIQNAFDGIFDNMYNVEQKGFGKILFGVLNFLFKEVLGSWSRMFTIGSHASDHLQHVVVSEVLKGGDLRDRLTDGIYIPTDTKEHVGRLDHAMKLVHQSEAIEKKVRDAVKKKVLAKQKGPALFEAAKAQNVITTEEFNLWKEAAAARYDAILVDEFTQEQYHARG
ncbi:MAG: acyl-CoA dehydrogenase domain-containing protein, partial [Pseudobdellovibrionaceae bacterium]